MSIESVSLSLPSLEVASNRPIDPSDGFKGNPVSDVDFSNMFKNVLDKMNTEQIQASDKVKKVELGESDDLVGAMISSQKASLNFSMLVQIRNKVVQGFDEIMRMPV